MLQKFTKRKRLLTAAMLLCFCVFTNNVMAWVGNGTSSSPWDISDKSTSGNNVTAYISGSTLYINGNGNMADFWNSTEGEAPWHMNYYSNYASITAVNIQNAVRNVGNRAFKDLRSLQTITIPSSVKVIGRQAFYMEKVTNTSFQQITIPNTVDKIEGEAFLNCSNLRTVTIENGSGDLNFVSCQEGGSCGYYKYDWFKGCSNLTTLYLGRNYIYDGFTPPFSGTSLQTLTIGNTVTIIRNGAFQDCGNLKTVNIEGGTFPLRFQHGFVEKTHFKNCHQIETLNLGRDLETKFDTDLYSDGIPFSEKQKLKSVTIGKDVNTINANSFKNCVELTSITIPNVTSIGSEAFAGCRKLTSIAIPNGVTSLERDVFADCGLISIIIPNTVSIIRNGAFQGCGNLKTVNIERGTFPLRFQHGFEQNTHFRNCPIETLDLGRDIETKFDADLYSNGNPFAENSALKSVTVGNTVTTVNASSFYNCTGLTAITSQNPTPPTAGSNCFSGVNKTTCKLTVPAGAENAYRVANEWKDFFNTSGIDDVVANQLKIFPNPAKEEIFIKADLQIEKVEIYSLTGALLILESNFNEKLFVSDLSEGVYLLKVHTDKGLAVSKIVKE